MTLQHINIEELTVSPLNVRKYGARDCADLVSSIRALGVLQPLLVREAEAGFEVIAGQRRLNACRILAEEGEVVPIPCMVMDKSDDVTAIEASLAENIERLPMDEVDQYKAFATLVKEGRTAPEIAQSFGITERMVTQRLALGQLHSPVLTAYRKGDLHARDVQILTMATARQQKAWWALVKDENAYVPTGQRLKDWLFGGAHIPVENALFDVEVSGLAVVSDLFGKDAYFADSVAFWTHQNEAIVAMMAEYKDAGWSEVVVMDIGAYFAKWDYRSTTKKDGGKVYVTCSNQGEVTAHEGYITQAEAKRRDKASTPEVAKSKPELTKAAQAYVNLHRHAAVQADLLQHSGTALRLIAAHMICGSALWDVKADAKKAPKHEIDQSLHANTGQQALDAEIAEVETLLGIDPEEYLLEKDSHWNPRPLLEDIYEKLTGMDDETILRILTLLMAQSLTVGSPFIDTLGLELKTDLSEYWTPDQTFLDLIRDKQVLDGMITELAGESVAQGNLTETAKTKRSILSDCLSGTRSPVYANWMPRYMAFPIGSYREEIIAPEDAVIDVDSQAA